jgi:hypothetical protein
MLELTVGVRRTVRPTPTDHPSNTNELSVRGHRPSDPLECQNTFLSKNELIYGPFVPTAENVCP